MEGVHRMKQDETRLKLLNGTIHVIARQGLDKTTTKQISLETGINEVYIYRCFNDKEDLFTKCFDALDDELAENIFQHASVMYIDTMEFELRCRFYFSAIWSFLLGNRDKCLAYVRYYYSEYFNEFSVASHQKRYQSLIEKFKSAFKDEADIWMILNHILNVMLDFAVKVHNNQMPKEDNYAEHVFRVIYASVKQYFKEGIGESIANEKGI